MLWGGKCCSGDLLWGEVALGRCQLLWGVNLLWGGKCCSGALGRNELERNAK
ncbi:MAG TPA: hypothetical protein PLR86_06735 [Planctomycetota bacterium]|nr:hypothetical protein [Planctomycetota bacterium]